MSRRSATRRASSTAPSAQQASSRSISGMLSSWGQTFSVTPTTSCPCCLSSAAVTELSTPPDMPTMTLAMGRLLDDSKVYFHGLTGIRGGIVLHDAPGAHGWVDLVLEADEE